MLHGRVTLQIFAPTVHDPLTKPVSATISNHRVEFNDVSFTDLQGDPFIVQPTSVDIKGSHIYSRILGHESGQFADVNGFNGTVLTFASLGNQSIHSAHINWNNTTLGIEAPDVFFSKNKLWVNVEGLFFDPGDKMDIVLGFKVHGNAHRDNLSGQDGDDLLVGGRGDDTLTGHSGADTFQFNAGASSGAISDFHAGQGDRIDLSHRAGGEGRTDGQHFSFIGDHQFSGDGGAEVRVDHTTGDIYVITADTDGDGHGDLTVNVHSNSGLHAGDFNF
jgi:Ca2+-binding RTX toxin-like protein